MAEKITSLRKLKEALGEMGVEVSERKLTAAMDDGCPGKSVETDEYEPARVREFLAERGLIDIPEDNDTPDPAPAEAETESSLDEKRAPVGAVFCPPCFDRGDEVRLHCNRSTGIFQLYKPCPKCGFKHPARVKPKVKDLVAQARHQQARSEPAVQRP
jgi:predicted RNA-binding Zn-ribbon protein involved in translation (DUF1610 family)